MPIFIAKEYDGTIQDIVVARDKGLATVYWQGKGIYPHSVDVRTESQVGPEHPTGVLPMLSTEKLTLSPFGRNPREYTVVKK